MEIEQTVNKRKKITRLLLILLIILLSLGCIKYLISKSKKYISENGKSSMGAVVEQIQQTYDLQVSGYYSQLQLVEEFLLHERELSLETDTNKSFFEAWEKESESTLIFLQENGQAISAGGTKMRIDMPSKLLLDLKNGYNIGKLVRLDYDQKKKDGYLVAIPCQEYTINGETYTAIGTVYDHSKLDSMLKLKGYDGKAYLFMLDDDGNITYTNLSGDKYQRNYSLLKHLKGEQAITEEEADLFKKKFDNRESGVALLGKQNPYYLGYCPIESNNTILVCIVAKGVVDNVLMDYQKTVLFTTILMAGFILLLFAGLFYSISRLSLADQKAEYEKRNNELHLQTMKEMEVVNQKLKKAKNVATEALQTAENANKAKTDFLSNMSHDIRTPMNAIIGITSLIRHDAGNKAKVIEYADKIDISSQHLLGIINDVLDMSKIEAGKTVFKYSDFSILDFIEELDTIFHSQIYEKKQTLTIIKENIPVSAGEDEVRVVRDKIDDIVTYIVSLIDESVEYLPLNIQNEAAEMGRITRPAAKAIKAKILAFAASPFFNGNLDYANFKNAEGEPFFNQVYDNEKWTKAADACLEAIQCAEEAGHGLYEFVNMSSTQLSDETILSLSNRCKVTERWNKELVWGCGQSGIRDLQVLCQPWLESNYSSDDRYHNARNGTFAPTLAVAETFYTKNGVPMDEDKNYDYSKRYTTQVATEADKYYIQPGYTTAKLHFDREPRFYATLGFDGSSWYGIGKMDDNDMWYLQAKAKQASGKRGNTLYSITGYFAKKLVRYQNAMVPASIQIETYPFPIIRLADLYLLYAEALNEAKKEEGTVPEDCYTYIDKVRARAGLKGVKDSWRLYANDANKPNTYEGFQTIVRKERMIELALEGQRFWDIRRWNLANQYFNKSLQGWDINQSETNEYYKLNTYFIRNYEDRENLWPLKDYDCIVNPKLVQNPGW